MDEKNFVIKADGMKGTVQGNVDGTIKDGVYIHSPDTLLNLQTKAGRNVNIRGDLEDLAEDTLDYNYTTVEVHALDENDEQHVNKALKSDKPIPSVKIFYVEPIGKDNQKIPLWELDLRDATYNEESNSISFKKWYMRFIKEGPKGKLTDGGFDLEAKKVV